MIEYDAIIGAISSLTYDEKFKLRLLLDRELEAEPAQPEADAPAEKRSSGLIDMFADEPELMDSVLEAMHERRSRPSRLDPSLSE